MPRQECHGRQAEPGGERDLKNRGMSLDGTFNGGSAAVATTGWDMPRTRANVAVGAGVEIARDLTLNVDARLERGNDWKATRLNAGLRYAF